MLSTENWDNWGKASLLVRFTALTCAENLKNYKYINAALAHYVKNTPMTGLASSKGLTPNPDILHFNTKSLMEFGKRYYEVFKRL